MGSSPASLVWAIWLTVFFSGGILAMLADCLEVVISVVMPEPPAGVDVGAVFGPGPTWVLAVRLVGGMSGTIVPVVCVLC